MVMNHSTFISSHSPMSTIAETQNRKLTDAEIQEYLEKGFLVVKDFFPVEELQEIDTEMTRLRSTPVDQEGVEDKKNFILQLGLRSELTRSLVADERIVDLIEDVVKPGVAIYSSKLCEKLPQDTTICHWHQDDAYYRENSESEARMSVWIPLQDCDETNGCIWFVPGSHRKGLQNFENRSHGICKKSFADGRDSMEGAIPVSVQAGDIVLFHSLTWHRSLENKSDQFRRAFIISYQDAEALRGNRDQHKILRSA